MFSMHASLSPEWLPDFVRYMAQMRLNSDGELETLKAADWLVLRERVARRSAHERQSGHQTSAACENTSGNKFICKEVR